MTSEEIAIQLERETDTAKKIALMITYGEKLRTRDYAAAKQIVQQAITLAEQCQERGLLAKGLYTLGLCFVTAFDLRGALPSLVQAARLYSAMSNTLMYARAMQYIALVYGEMGEGERAMRIHKRNLRVYAKYGSSEDKALTWMYIGRLYELRGILPQALKAFGKVYSIWSTSGNRVRVAQILHNMGSVYYWLQDFDKALEHYQKTLEIQIEENNPVQVAICKQNIGALYAATGKHREAIEELEAAIALYRERNMQANEATANSILGRAHLELNRPDLALQCYELALPVARQMGHLQLYFTVLTRLALLFARQQQWKVAVQYVRRAEKIANKTHEEFQQYEVYRTFAEVYETQGDYAKAFEYYRKQNTIGEQLFGSRAHRDIAVQESKSELRRLKKELAELQEQRRELRQQAQNHTREIAAKNIHLIQKQEFLEHLSRRITQVVRTTPPSKSNVLRGILQELHRNALPESEWQAFEARFQQLDEELVTRLRMRFPKLSRSELKVCLLLRMNLATKEIADLLYVSSRTVDFHRNRIRKKLGMQPDESFASFLCAI